MKKRLLMLMSGVFVACGPVTGDKSANDKGIQPVDTNGIFGMIRQLIG